MAKCKNCKKRRLFLKLNNDRLCLRCEAEKRKLARENRLKEENAVVQAELSKLSVFDFRLSDELRSRRTDYRAVPLFAITHKETYHEFVALYLKTTGPKPSSDRIIELAAVRFVNGTPTALFETLVRPEVEISLQTAKITGITDETVQNAPVLSQVLPAFEEFAAGSALVSHDPAFDLKILYCSGSRVTDQKRRYYSIKEQAKKRLKPPKGEYNREYGFFEIDRDSDHDVTDYSLRTLCRYYGVLLPERHSAAAGALAAGKLFLCLADQKSR